MPKYFLTAILFFAFLFAKSQNKSRLDKNFSSDDSTALLTIASYPDSVRSQVLQACQKPEVLVKAEALQKSTSQSFRDLVSLYSRDEQQNLWNLSRYPALINEIATGGKKSKEELETISSKYPPELKKTIVNTGRKQKAIQLAGALLDMSGKYEKGSGNKTAQKLLESGEALHKFMAICEAQGGFKEPTTAKYKHNVISLQDGTVKFIDCRKLAKLGKLAGAPKSAEAGIQFLSPLGKKIKKGDVLFIVYTDSVGELEYVRDYLSNINHFITIE